MTIIHFVRCFGDCAHKDVCGENMMYATQGKVLVEQIGNRKYWTCANYSGNRKVDTKISDFN